MRGINPFNTSITRHLNRGLYLSEIDNTSTIAPPAPSTSFLLKADGVSFLLQADGVSKIRKAQDTP